MSILEKVDIMEENLLGVERRFLIRSLSSSGLVDMSSMGVRSSPSSQLNGSVEAGDSAEGKCVSLLRGWYVHLCWQPRRRLLSTSWDCSGRHHGIGRGRRSRI